MADPMDDGWDAHHDGDSIAWTLAYEGSPVGVADDDGGYRCPACGDLLSLGSMRDATRLRINCNSAGGHQWTAEGPRSSR